MQGLCPYALRLMATDRSKRICRTIVRCRNGSPAGGLIEMQVFWGQTHKRFFMVVAPQRDAVGRSGARHGQMALPHSHRVSTCASAASTCSSQKVMSMA